MATESEISVQEASSTVLSVDAEEAFAAELVERARSEGVSLVGPQGVLNRLTKRVLEAALEAEMTEHVGYDKHESVGRNGGNSRNGTRAKTVLTDIGPIELEVPRDREGTFAPVTVPKRQRRLSGVDEMVISLSAKGLTFGEVQAHLAEVYGAEVSKETISRITDGVLETMAEWQSRPLDRVYPVIFVDAIHVKIREGTVANRPIYSIVAVTMDGERDILGLWVGPAGGEGAKFWMQVLSEVKNRGVQDCYMVVCDGLKGLPSAINAVWPQAIVQTCLLHLIRNTFRYASKADWERIAKDLRPIYTALNEAEARARFEEFTEKWGKKYPAIIKLWTDAWAEFVPFLAFDTEIRRVVCSTNAIESLYARFRRATRARGHYPNEQAALKGLYLVICGLDPTGRGRQRWITRWKQPLNAFAVALGDRLNQQDN